MLSIGLNFSSGTFLITFLCAEQLATVNIGLCKFSFKVSTLILLSIKTGDPGRKQEIALH